MWSTLVLGSRACGLIYLGQYPVVWTGSNYIVYSRHTDILHSISLNYVIQLTICHSILQIWNALKTTGIVVFFLFLLRYIYPTRVLCSWFLRWKRTVWICKWIMHLCTHSLCLKPVYLDNDIVLMISLACLRCFKCLQMFTRK